MARVRSVLPVDFLSPEHRAVIVDTAFANSQHVFNDYDTDIALILNAHHEWADAGFLHAFIALVNDQPAGVFWIQTDHYEIGRVRGGLLPEYRTPWNAMHFLKWLTGYGFEILQLRKLDAEMSMYKASDKDSQAAERILKRIGFQFRCKLPESLLINGQPKDTILLDYLRKDYLVKTESI